MAAGSVVLLLWKPLANPAPMLLWNASLSVPIGLYRVEKRVPIRGEIAVASLPEWATFMASESHYLPRGVWLLKPVAGAESNVVCRFGQHVFIDGRLVARALVKDRSSRPMPSWQRCRRLNHSQFFLLSKHKDSLDSRYFGPVESGSIVGTAKPILLFGR
jgi:conjugative transfer signal peptidase TraF